MPPRRVALFVTCLVDMMRPSVGFAAIKLLEEAGCAVVVPPNQTCCGQPAWNNGDRGTARDLAWAVIEAFEPYEATVVPSGSCAGMIVKSYPSLFADDPVKARRAESLAAKTFELTSFLVEALGEARLSARWPGLRATYHDSCSGLRELGVKDQPRALLAQIDGVSLTEMQDAEVCCGFGGTFCVKYPDISNRMVTNKVDAIAATEADVILAGDLGCLMNIAGKLSRCGSKTQARHVAEVLAGCVDVPPIGAPTR